MGEEAEVKEPEVKEPEVDVPEVNPVEELAQKLGWNPDFEGDDAVDAETFILRSRDISRGMSRTIGGLKRELSAVKEGLDTVKFTAEQASKREINRLKGEINRLKGERRKAIEDGDVGAVDRFDAQIDELNEAAREPEPPKKTEPGPPPEYNEWVAKNNWYVTDPEMQAYANALLKVPEYDAIGKVSYPRLLKKVEKAVKTEFPDKFPASKDNTNSAAVATTPAAPVTPSRQRAKPSKVKVTAADLTYEQRQVGQTFVGQGVYKSLDDYAEALQSKYEKKEG